MSTSSQAEALTLIAAGKSHVGLVRQRNEDQYLIDNALGLFLVADGMGGHYRGDIASQTACREVRDNLADGMSLPAAVRSANDSIVQQAREGEQRRPMGTTLVAVQMVHNVARVLWVGDSRLYLWRDGLSQLSRDHSAVQQLVDTGRISSEEARSHPHRNIITQALGAFDNDELSLDTLEVTLQPGDQLLLCSDGLTGEVEDNDIARIISSGASNPERICDRLVSAALEGGGSDNITVVVVGAQ
jgi:protein phosphatase